MYRKPGQSWRGFLKELVSEISRVHGVIIDEAAHRIEIPASELTPHHRLVMNELNVFANWNVIVR